MPTAIHVGDPRIATIEKRLAGVDRLVAVTGGKGGIGKSVVASSLALALAEAGRRVGLFDLDLTGPCAHLILGIETGFPEEKLGLVPPMVNGIRFMSISCFVGDKPAALRGEDVSNAIIELLTITQWGDLDFLVLDLPPGLSDATLDLVRLLPRLQFLVVTTASHVVLETVRKTLEFLKQRNADVLGVVENMRRKESTAASNLAGEFGIACLGAVLFDDNLEDCVGDCGLLAGTSAFSAIRELSETL